MNVNVHRATGPLLAAALTLLSLLCAPSAAAQAASPALTRGASEALGALATRPSGPLPAGTRLLSLHVTDGLAVADFSPELRDNFQGGDSQEVAVVNSILRVLGRDPAITRAQILVAGHPIDSLGGLLVLSDPLPVLRADQDNSGQPRRLFLHRKQAPAHAKHHRQSLT